MKKLAALYHVIYTEIKQFETEKFDKILIKLSRALKDSHEKNGIFYTRFYFPLK